MIISPIWGYALFKKRFIEPLEATIFMAVVFAEISAELVAIYILFSGG